jgi:hypothetical protein
VTGKSKELDIHVAFEPLRPVFENAESWAITAPARVLL